MAKKLPKSIEEQIETLSKAELNSHYGTTDKC